MEKIIDMKEVFKTIIGFENYIVSSDGYIIATAYLNKANKREKERKLRPSEDYSGYLNVCLTNNTYKKTKRVHRLVAEAFIPNPENKETVNHIDGNKLNNHVSNLEWNTRSEQLFHAYSLGLKSYSQNAKKKLIEKIGKTVKCVNKLTNEITYHDSARACSRFVGKSERWCDKIIGTQNGDTYNYSLSYNDIKDRKGEFRDGSFIKESDL